MSRDQPDRISVTWSPEARSDLRAIDRETAILILHCIDRYLSNRAGDVKKLKPPENGFRLRCGDYRVFFDQCAENHVDVTGVIGARLIAKSGPTTLAKTPDESFRSFPYIHRKIRIAHSRSLHLSWS